jgi:hypothetical protein
VNNLLHPIAVNAEATTAAVHGFRRANPLLLLVLALVGLGLGVWLFEWLTPAKTATATLTRIETVREYSRTSGAASGVPRKAQAPRLSTVRYPEEEMLLGQIEVGERTHEIWLRSKDYPNLQVGDRLQLKYKARADGTLEVLSAEILR